MHINTYLIIILTALLGRWLLETAADLLNMRNVRETIPEEFTGVYDADKYRRSQQYLRDHTRFGLMEDGLMTALGIAFILLGGFALANRLACSAGWTMIPTGLLFAAILMVLAKLVGLPFSIYETFVIEERYGFNKTTPRTFATDILKGLLLTLLIGGPVFAAILWFFDRTGTPGWLYAWGAVTLFQILLVFAAPYIIMPLFNKFTPLEEGELKTAIETYARAQSFKMKGVFKMDGSRRSAKSNAFFTGFGRSRRIVLLDTLIARHTVPELLAVVAHEMGHYKKKHIPNAILRSVATTGITFFLLSLFLGNTELADAFGLEGMPPLYASLVFFGYLYSPLAMALAIVESAVSRRHEYEADRFVLETTGEKDAMIQALKKLSVDNLANLTPHPLKVFIEYSHPPILERIAALRAATAPQQQEP